jgi:hypothetical protein
MANIYNLARSAIVGAGILAIASFGEVYAQGGCNKCAPKPRPELKEGCKEERGWYIPRVPLGPRQNFEPKRKVDESCCPRYFVRQYEPK